MKTKKFLAVCLAAIIAATSILVSCERPTGGGDPDCVSEYPKDENTVVVWWGTDSAEYNILNDAWYDFREAALTSDKYSDRNYSEKINMFAAPGDIDGTSLLEMQIVAGTAPDLIRMDHVYITKLGYKKNVLDLNAKYNVENTLKDKFIESCWDASSYKDPKTGDISVYGIPFDANTIIFGGNKQYLKMAGINELPATYGALLDAGSRLNALNLEVYPYTLPCGTDKERYNWPAFVFMFYVWRLGGDVLNKEMTEVTFNDSETGVKALQMMIAMGDAGIISKDAYQEGESVMCDYGTWKYNDIKEDMMYGLLPELKAGVERYSGLGLYDLSVVSTALNPDLAFDFAVHLATEKSLIKDEYYQYTFVKNKNLLPSLVAAGDSQDFKDSTKADFWKVSLQQLKLSKYRPPVPCWQEIEEIISKAVTQAVTREKSPAEALDTAANQANDLLEKYKKK